MVNHRHKYSRATMMSSKDARLEKHAEVQSGANIDAILDRRQGQFFTSSAPNSLRIEKPREA
jgi:hypothetical protein